MANNILITPGSSNIQFSGSSDHDIKLETLADGAVQFSGESGSLLNISDGYSGSLMSVSDVSGVPIFDVNSDDTVTLGQFSSPIKVLTNTSGNTIISGSSTSTGSFGKIEGSVTIPSGKALKTSLIRGGSDVEIDTEGSHLTLTSTDIRLANGQQIEWNNANTRILASHASNYMRFDIGGVSNVLYLTNGQVNIGNSSVPNNSAKLGVTGNINVGNGQSNSIVYFENSGTDMYIQGTSSKLNIGSVGNTQYASFPAGGALELHQASAGTVTARTDADNLVIESSVHSGLSILTPDNQYANIVFGSPTTNRGANIEYNYSGNIFNIGTFHANGKLAFFTGASNERMTITSAGKVGIGTNNPGVALLNVFSSTAAAPFLYVGDGDANNDGSWDANIMLDSNQHSRLRIENRGNNKNLEIYSHTGGSEPRIRATDSATSLELGVGATKSVTIGTNPHLTVHGAATVDGNMTVTGTLTAEQFITEYTTQTIIATSGSTKFGNTLDDIHQVTGSLRVTGSGANVFSVSHRTGTNPLFTVDNDGGNHMVGINTTPSQGMLDVRANGQDRYVFAIINAGGTQVGGFYNAGNRNVLQLKQSNGTVGINFDPGSNSYFNTGGNLGIGTTSPGAILDIVGPSDGVNLRLSDVAGNSTTKEARIGMRHYTEAEEDTALMYAQSGNGTSAVYIGGGTGVMNAVESIGFVTAATDTTLSGTTRMFIDASGNVGIGTTSPAELLHINAGSSNSAYIKMSSTGTGEAGFFLDGDDGDFSGHYTFIGVDNTNNNLTFNMVGADDIVFKTTNTERMRINSSGNVGIGTSSPDTSLEIIGTQSSTNGNLKIASSNSTSAGITLFNTGANTASARNWGIMTNFNAEGDFVIRKNSSQNGNLDTTALAIISSGNVGIGTTAPAAKLHVNSDISLGADADNRTLLGYSSNTFSIGTRQSSTNYLDTVSITGGKVGIGTTDPKFAHLNVVGDISLGIHTANLNRRIGLQRGDGAGWTNTPHITFSSDGGSDGSIKFSVIDSGVAGYPDAMVINKSGNVGIGTTSPSSKLEIEFSRGTTLPTTYDVTHANSSAPLDGELVIKNTANNEVGSFSSLFFYAGQQSATPSLAGVGKITLRKSSAASYVSEMGFWTRKSDGDLNQNMVIDSDGNVGIGTDNPGSMLQIDGNGGLDVNAGAATLTVSTAAGGQLLYSGYGFSTATSQATMNNASKLSFQTANTVRLEITSQGYSNFKQWIQSNGTFALYASTGDGLLLQAPSNVQKIFFRDVSGNTGMTYDAANQRLRVGDATSPTHDLDVSGTGRFTSTLTVGSEILNTNFSSSIAGRVATLSAASSGITISNNVNNRVLTGDGTNANAESGLTFDGTVLSVGSGGRFDVTVANAGGSFMTVNHTGNEAWSFGAQSGAGSDDYLDIGISGGTRAMSWHETGNVGIGTTTPGSKLEILQGVGNGSSYDVIKIDGNTGNYGGMWMAGEWAAGQQGRIGFYATSTSNKGVALIGNAGTTPHLFVNASGNVGIGTNNPSAKLHIYGGDWNTQLTIQNDNANNNGIRFMEDGGAINGYIYGRDTGTISFLDPTGNYAYRHTHSTSHGWYLDSSQLMALTTTGLGIGVTNPVSKLHVANDILIENDTDTNGAESVLYFKVDSQDTAARRKAAIVFQRVNSTGVGNLHFAVDDTVDGGDATAAANTRLFISGSGKIGIGTTSPDRMLTIRGDGSGANAYPGIAGYTINTILWDLEQHGGYEGRLSLYNSGVNKVRFRADGTSYINNGANFGIGNASPVYNLDVTGNIRASAQFRASAGGASAPAIAFADDPNTGIYNDGSNDNLQFSTGGVHRAFISATQFNVVGNIVASGNLTTGGQILSPGGANIALNPNTGVVSMGGVFQTTGTGNSTMAGNLVVAGNITAQQFITEYTTDTVIATSGSTSFGNSASNTHAFTGNVSVTDGLVLTDTNAGAGSNPTLTLHRNSASPDMNDLLGMIEFKGEDSISSSENYADITAKIEDPTHTGEDGALRFRTMKAGTLTDTLWLQQGSVGIGTTYPSSKLEINTPDSTSALRLGSDSHAWLLADKGQNNHGGVLYLQRENGSVNTSFNSSPSFNSYINAQGANLGIGTSSPGSTLHVHKASGPTFLRISDESVGNGLEFGYENGGFTEATIYNRYASNAASKITHGFGTPSSGNIVMTMLQSGNIGIGVVNPNQKLKVSGGHISIDDDYRLVWGGNTGSSIAGSTANDYLRFYTDGSERVRINNTGVGIGTTSPAHKLHVQGDLVRIVNSTYAGIEYHNTNGTWKAYLGTENGGGGIRYNSADSQHTFYNNSTAIVRIATNGNVGIGETSPSAKLTVAGSTIFNSGLGDNDFTVNNDAKAAISLDGTAQGTGTTHHSGRIGIMTANNVHNAVINLGGNANSYFGGGVIWGTAISHNISAHSSHAAGLYVNNMIYGGNGQTNPVLANAFFDTPTWVEGSSNTINLAANVYISGAPSVTNHGGPSHAIHIAGGTSYFNGNIELTANDKIFVDGNSENSIEYYNGSTGAMKLTAGASGVDYGMEFHQNNAQAMTIKTGKVGIGTATPGSYYNSPLVTYKASTNYLTIATNTDGVSSILMADGTSGDTQYRGQLEYKHNGDEWRFHAGNQAVMSLRDEKVGIGTTNPTHDLTVSSTTPTIKLQSDNGTARGYIYADASNNMALLDSDGHYIIQSTTDTSIRFYINNSEKVTFLASGNVGIGTATPIRALDIKATGDPGIRLESAAQSADVVTLRNGDGRIGFGRDAITTLTDGKVGIGAASPQSTLEVSTTSGIILRDNASAGGGGMNIFYTSANGYYNMFAGMNSTNNFNIGSVGTDTTPIGNTKANHLTVQGGTGNVGIGNVSPSFPLDVAADSSTAIARFVNAGSSSPSGLFVNLSGGTPNDRTDYYLYATGGGGDISLFTDGGANFAGNVGIGNTNPSNKLDIKGDGARLHISSSDFPLVKMGGYASSGGYEDVGYLSLMSAGSEAIRLGAHSGISTYFTQNVGIGITSPSVALDVSGTIEATADVIAYASSDERLKENIKTIENPIEKVKQIRGVEFDWKEGNEDIHHNKGHDTGLIAQDVEKVVPEIVKDREDGYKGVRYEKLVGLLVESVKEQQKQIEELQSEIKELKDGSSK